MSANVAYKTLLVLCKMALINFVAFVPLKI